MVEVSYQLKLKIEACVVHGRGGGAHARVLRLETEAVVAHGRWTGGIAESIRVPDGSC